MENTWVRRNPWIFVLAPFAIALFAWLFGEVVMHLWNWLLPGLFKLPQITFWQALGLLVLSRILFGGFGGHNKNRSRWGQPSQARWAKMTPEEREKFRQRLRARCGSFDEPAGEGGGTV
jgi:hypothetical protein